MAQIEIKHTSNTCEDYGYHVGSRVATSDNPVLHINTDSGESIWRCLQCTIKRMNGESSTSECSNCGTEVTTMFCDASCAMEYGYEGGHECTGTCQNCGESDASYCSAGCAVQDGSERPNCTQCGDWGGAYYCSVSCAVSDGGEIECAECAGYATVQCNTPECAGHAECTHVPTSQPTLVAAASNVTDEGTVSVDGIEFRFS